MMSFHRQIYLDRNASAPLSKETCQFLKNWIHATKDQELHFLFANPSSLHQHGRLVRKYIEQARGFVASSLGKNIHSEQLIFTSSGTESNQTVIRSVLEPLLWKREKAHWILSRAEHDSVLQMVPWFEKHGGEVSWIELSSEGEPLLEKLPELIRPETKLVSVLLVQNELGVVTHFNAWPKWLAEKKILLHIDAAQAWGKIPLNLDTLGASYVTFSAHKIGAPAGGGVIYLKQGVPFEPLILGHQELGRRGGTENWLGWILIGESCKHLNPLKWDQRVKPLRDFFELELKGLFGAQCMINGEHASLRVGHVSNVTFRNLPAQSLILALDLEGVSVSAGSACSTGVQKPSHVLLAIGRSAQEALSSVRFSWDVCFTEEDVKKVLDHISGVIRRFQNLKFKSFRNKKSNIESVSEKKTDPLQESFH